MVPVNSLALGNPGIPTPTQTPPLLCGPLTHLSLSGAPQPQGPGREAWKVALTSRAPSLATTHPHAPRPNPCLQWIH